MDRPAVKKMSFSDVVFPLTYEPYADESGIGFCLRAASKNGANLHAIRRLIGMEGVAVFTQIHSAVLARLFQTDMGWLQKSLPTPEKSSTIDWCGHRFSVRYHLRKTPQICPFCVHQYGYTKAVWDLGLSTLCIEHSCWFVDGCMDCGQRLRWDRPSIDVGHCGHIVKHPLPRSIPSASHMAFQHELEDRFNHDLIVEKSFLSQDLAYGITLDCWLGIVIALGLKERPYQVIRQLNRQRTTQEWTAIACRAIERSPLTGGTNQVEIPRSSEIVAEAPLIRVAKYATAQCDICVSTKLLRRFFGDKVADHSGLQLPRVSQLEMF